MEDYFSRFESQPNAAEIHIDAMFKKDAYKDYLLFKQSTGIYFNANPVFYSS